MGSCYRGQTLVLSRTETAILALRINYLRALKRFKTTLNKKETLKRPIVHTLAVDNALAREVKKGLANYPDTR